MKICLRKVPKNQKKKLGNLGGVFLVSFFFFLMLSLWLGIENIGGTKKSMWEIPYTIGEKNP